MSTDIYGAIEVRDLRSVRIGSADLEDVPWFRGMDLFPLLAGNDYAVFGSLFGVRNVHGWTPVAEGRGLPDDVSDEMRSEYSRACEFLLFQQKGDRRAAWEKVTGHLRNNPGCVAARTLSYPLALSLARDTYTHTHAHPTDLLEHHTSDALLRHLLTRLMAISYPDADEHAHAVRWLSWIAKKLDGLRDIRLWDIPGWMIEDEKNLGNRILIAVGIEVGVTSGLNVGSLILQQEIRFELL
ncbi:hypothetical protein [Actinoplanes rectilineatus]|uniref:hypothetical protein n=1 Tax=Actinoplanes rectilineatus TaxID=113571 RepID=UPI00069880B7|nr:hypothetical protein [Actinoplanes rectilineatus]